MKVCRHCGKDLPDDATFCQYCGTQLTVTKKTKRKINAVDDGLKDNPRKNSWANLGFIFFIVGVVVFDFLAAAFFPVFGLSNKIPFYISFVLYIVAFACGAASLIVDRKDKKAGYRPCGNKTFAIVCCTWTWVLCLINLTQVILK